MKNNYITLYVNGILEDNVSIATDIFNINRISNSYSAIAAKRFFDGQVDEIRIYNRSLSTTEIE